MAAPAIPLDIAAVFPSSAVLPELCRRCKQDVRNPEDLRIRIWFVTESKQNICERCSLAPEVLVPLPQGKKEK